MRRSLLTLTKKQLIESIRESSGYSKKRSSELFVSLMEIVKSTLESGEKVLISGFGTFCVKFKAARKGRNPQTGKDLILGERRNLTFGCSTSLRDKLNGHRKENGVAKR
jgi:integration host factor subunit alpha